MKWNKAHAKLLVGIEDAIKNLESVNLTLKQSKALEEAILKLKEELTEEEVKSCLKNLIDVGLMPIPRLERLRK